VARSSSTPLTSNGCATWPAVAVDLDQAASADHRRHGDQVAALSTTICDRVVAVGDVDDTTALTTDAGESARAVRSPPAATNATWRVWRAY
jgi:hypothetical protein